MTRSLQPIAIDGAEPIFTSPPPGPLHGVLEIGQAEADAVNHVLQRKTMFRFLNKPEVSESAHLEARYREMTGQPYALAIGGGGTGSLICGLVGLGIGSGDEVIVPGYTYIATAAACLSVGAIPILAEIDQSLTLDPADVERKITEHTRAIIPVHMRGSVANMDAVMEIADRYGIAVLEDVAQANGATFHGHWAGAIGHAGAFSLQHYKLITASEGGLLITADEQVYKRAAIKHDSAMQFWADDATWPAFAGENYRMCELRAALALAQLDRLPGILERTRPVKAALLERTRHLDRLSQQTLHCAEGDCGITFALFARSTEAAQQFSEALAAEGLPNATIYNHQIPDRHIYRAWDYVLEKRTSDPTGWPWTAAPRKIEYDPGMLPQTLDVLGRCVAIAINQQWQDEHVDLAVRAITRVHDALAERGLL